MDRRDFLTLAGVVGVAGTPARAQAPQGQPAGAEEARLNALFERVYQERIDRSPEAATRLGVDTGPRAALRGRLSDRTRARAAQEAALNGRVLAELRTIDRDALSPAARLNYDVVEYGLVRGQAAERFDYGARGGYQPYVISQLSGAYRDVPDFLDGSHRVQTAADADAFLSRLSAFPRVLDQETERQREDAGKGVFAPDYILDTTLTQLDALTRVAPADTVLVKGFAAKLAAANLPTDAATRAATIVEREVMPALGRTRALVAELRGRATHDAGVWRLPDGGDYYAGSIAAATTTALSADEVHAIGLEQVAEIEAQLDPLLRAEGLSEGTPGARLVALNERPDQLFANDEAGRAALLAMLNRQIRAMEPKLPLAFATLPRAPVEVRRVPEHIQAGAPGGYYQSASVDGSRPGIYYINLRDTFDRPKFGLATLTHHEAVPGHHLQVSLALESDAIPAIRRSGGYSAYTEGWALYSEQLADELGLFEGDTLGRIGYLQSLLFRATRLVVDTGLHHKRWSRERATDYFIATTGIARGRSQGEIDRYTVWPGQATSYKIGHTVWTRLREAERRRLGDRFDLKQFHEILRLGAMPLTVLERTMAARAAA